MKFIKLESRGGNYLVVAENVAWLRTAENGQTNVGIIGGQPLLVVGSIEEVAERILSATAETEAPAAVPMAATSPVAPPASPQPVAEAPAVQAEEPKPEQEPEADTTPAKMTVPARTRNATARSAAQWERPSSSAAASAKLKGGSQRMMGRFE